MATTTKRPAQQVRELKSEIRGLLAKVADEKSVCDSPIFTDARDLEMSELKAAYEVEMQSLRLEVATQKSLARKLSRESNHSAIFEEYERTISRLRKRCASLRRRNVSLETEPYSPRGKVARRLELKIAQLEEENGDLRTRLRNLPLAERVAKAQIKIASKASEAAENERKELETERSRSDSLRDQLEMARATISELALQNDELKQDRVQLNAKLRALRGYVHSLPISTDSAEKFRVADFKRLSHCRKDACSVSFNNYQKDPSPHKSRRRRS